MSIARAFSLVAIASCAAAAAYFFLLRTPVQPASAGAAPRTMKTEAETPEVAQRILRLEDLPPVSVRKLTPEELTPALIRKADEVLLRYDAPVGTEVMVEANGRTFVARFEQHYHEMGGPKRPWGVHKGITLYAAE